MVLMSFQRKINEFKFAHGRSAEDRVFITSKYTQLYYEITDRAANSIERIV